MISLTIAGAVLCVQGVSTPSLSSETSDVEERVAGEFELKTLSEDNIVEVHDALPPRTKCHIGRVFHETVIERDFPESFTSIEGNSHRLSIFRSMCTHKPSRNNLRSLETKYEQLVTFGKQLRPLVDSLDKSQYAKLRCCSYRDAGDEEGILTIDFAEDFFIVF